MVKFINLLNIKVVLYLAAGNAFSEAAKVQYNQLQCKHEAATQFVEAANCYRKIDYEGMWLKKEYRKH